MTSNFDTLSMLVHASSKVGKSTLSSTAPPPTLVLDAEGGWRFINGAGFRGERKIRKRAWNPLTEPVPRHDDTWDAVVVTVKDWATLQRVFVVLTQQQHDFKSLVLDSITEIQRRCKANLRGTEQMRIQDWGDLLTQMDSLIRGFRDLVLLDNPLQFVMFIAETAMDEGKWRPAMQGQIKRSLPYWVDICGYLYVDQVKNEQGETTGKARRLLITPHPLFEAGERVQGVLGDVITEPNVSDMMNTIFGNAGIIESIKEVSQ